MELGERFLARASLLLAMTGLLMLYAFQEGYRDADAASLARDCSGKVSVDGSVKSAFFTKSGSYAVSLSKEVFALLKSEAAFSGDRILVRGRAQASGGSQASSGEQASGGKCWIFADSVRVL